MSGAELPYLNAYGYVKTVLEKVIAAPTPPKFTQDFLQTKLGISSSSARPIIPFLKHAGFLAADGSPTDRYKRFRNQPNRGSAAAEGLREAFLPLYEANEYAHELSGADLNGLILQVTGLDSDNKRVKAIASSFSALSDFADFENGTEVTQSQISVEQIQNQNSDFNDSAIKNDTITNPSKLNIGYTINLNLPETTNPEVFEAIFSKLKEHILK